MGPRSYTSRINPRFYSHSTCILLQSATILQYNLNRMLDINGMMCCPKPPEAHSTNILLILFSFYCRMGVYRMSRISVELHFPWFVLKSGSRIANFLLQAYLGEILLIVPFYSHSTVELKVEWVECTHTPQRFWNSRQTRIRTSHVLCHVSDVNYIKVVAATYMHTVAPTPPLVFWFCIRCFRLFWWSSPSVMATPMDTEQVRIRLFP